MTIDPPVHGALAALTVIEMAAIGPVPFAGMLLSDMGANVTRIDRIPDATAGADATPHFDGRGRRSIAVNLKHPQGVETVLRLAATADVLLEGFRPGVMERLGLGPDALEQRNPGLIYGRMTGWGQTGPLANAAGHDLNYIAISGALHAMGPADRPPPPPLNLVGDYGGGALLLLVGILAALQERQRTGRGQVIDAAMSDGAALLMAPIYSLLAHGQWSDRRGANLLDGAGPFYGCYECADGHYISIGSIEPQFYRRLLDACDIDDPDFLDQHDTTRWPRLRGKLEALFRRKTRAQWCALLEGTDVCFAPVLSMGEAPEHPHNRFRGTFLEMQSTMQPAPAPRFSRTPSIASSRIPRIGEDSAAVLRAAGLSDSEILKLTSEGAVYALA